MATNSILLFVLLGFLNLLLMIDAQDRTFLITAPRLLRLDAMETFVVQVFDAGDISVKLSLRKSLVSTDTEFASQTVQLNAGNNYQAAAHMRLFSKDVPVEVGHVYLRAVANGINVHERIPVARDNGFLFIQTDKPLYTPEQSVKVRVYALSEELSPAKRKVTLTFRDPEAVKVEVIDLEDVSGIISLQRPFKIPLKPKLGLWTIEASFTEDFSTSSLTHFEVKEYVLPSIIVNIVPEQTYISHANMDAFKLTVTAKYAHGAPVVNAYVLSRFGYVSEDDTIILPRTFRTLQLLDGKAELIVNVSKALSSIAEGEGPKSLQQLQGNNLYVLLTVEERKGGVSQQAELATVKFVASPFSLSLLATPLFIKPALPYTIRALVKGPSGEAVRGVPVRISASVTDSSGQQMALLYSSQQQESVQVSRDDGVAYFTYNIPSNALKAHFHMETADEKLSAQDQALLSFKADTYQSPRGRYLYIDLPSYQSAVQVQDYINVKVYFHYREYLTLKTFSYQVLSKGRVVKHGTQPRRGTQTEVITLQVTPDMAPSARLLVYYIQPGEGAAELVADSVWFDVRDKCVNGLKVALSVPGSQYKPKEELLLQMKAKPGSVVALSAVDTALHAIRLKHTDPLNAVLRHVEMKDLGCGGGGGRDNADVFNRAGVIFMTNANAKAIIEGSTCSDVVRSKRAVTQEQYEEIINNYPKGLRHVCRAGLYSNPTLESCHQRAVRLVGRQRPHMLTAFQRCCEEGVKLRGQGGVVTLSRTAQDWRALFASNPLQVRSYFPESWLWEEHLIQDSSGQKEIRRNLPDSLTTWQMRAVGLSSNGVCVSDPVSVSVSQEVSVDVPLPYSMVRGEQLELKGSIYNQHTQESQFSLTLEASEGICVFRGASSVENRGVLEGNSVHLVHFYIMALESGSHSLNFTLNTRWGRERLVKTLRVTPEGILTEENTGATIDPQGIYGSARRRVELRNSLPLQLVPNSPVERKLTITGEVFGEILSILTNPTGLQRLVNLPRGSAEQELVGLLPLYYVYHYMELGQHWATMGPDANRIRADLKARMKEGLISIMSFKTRLHEAFSMWKNREPSTWLTALMVKTLSEVNKYTEVDGSAIAKFVYWLIDNCQKGDGSFIETSDYKPIKLMGAGADTTEQAAYLTSFVVIAIKNAMEIPECKLLLYKDALKKAQEFLFSTAQKGALKSMYVKAITTYALTLLDPSSIPAVTLYESLLLAATVKGNPPVVRFWQEASTSSPSSDSPLKPHKMAAQTVETTVYMLLAAILRGHSSAIKPVLTWLTQDQRYGGGFYSTQDTILTLEALAKYSALTKDAQLNMGVRAAYRTKGDLDFVTLTQDRPIGRAIDVKKDDDIILTTGLSTGVSVANLKTVYYKMSEENNGCHFDISIEVKPRDQFSNDYMELMPRIVSCARFKPLENEAYMEASHTVMEIQLPTGVNAVQEDLDMMQDGFETLISNYEIDGNKVIIQLDSVPSAQPYCVGFRIQEHFATGMDSGSLYRVYEYHDQENSCSKVYYRQERKLLRLCEKNQCHCMAAECCTFRSSLSSTAASLQREMCSDVITYALKVLVESSESEGDFVVYKAIIQDIFKKGSEDIKIKSEVELVKKATCSSTSLEVGKQYLVMGAEIMQIRLYRSYRYKFPLDSRAQLDVWPDRASCSDTTCNSYLKELDDFTFNILIDGC